MSVETLLATDFPESLKHWPNKSDRLWLLGNADLLSGPLAAVVGTRQITEEGAARTKKLTALLVREGFCVVSGLAEGVDAVAHRTALDNDGLTIAVMGTPIEECYPREHSDLKAEIVEKGLVISQFAPGSKVHRSNFPRRNTLMAALSEITFVVEAGVNSGTRHQVKAALQMGRIVAFLASLAEKNYPWIEEAMRSGLGRIIAGPEDALALLREIRIAVPNEPSSLSPIESMAETLSLPGLVVEDSHPPEAQPPELPAVAPTADGLLAELEFDFVQTSLFERGDAPTPPKPRPRRQAETPSRKSDVQEPEHLSILARLWRAVFG